MLSSRLNAFVIPTSQKTRDHDAQQVVRDELDAEPGGDRDPGGRELGDELRDRAQVPDVVDEPRDEQQPAPREDSGQLPRRLDRVDGQTPARRRPRHRRRCRRRRTSASRGRASARRWVARPACDAAAGARRRAQRASAATGRAAIVTAASTVAQRVAGVPAASYALRRRGRRHEPGGPDIVGLLPDARPDGPGRRAARPPPRRRRRDRRRARHLGRARSSPTRWRTSPTSSSTIRTPTRSTAPSAGCTRSARETGSSGSTTTRSRRQPSSSTVRAAIADAAVTHCFVPRRTLWRDAATRPRRARPGSPTSSCGSCRTTRASSGSRASRTGRSRRWGRTATWTRRCTTPTCFSTRSSAGARRCAATRPRSRDGASPGCR